MPVLGEGRQMEPAKPAGQYSSGLRLEPMSHEKKNHYTVVIDNSVVMEINKNQH